MEAMSAAALASRAMPPGKTRQPCTGSDTTNTRSITERGWMPAADCAPPRPACQVGICDKGR